jgi:HD-like signal output (HDOD) protein
MQSFDISETQPIRAIVETVPQLPAIPAMFLTLRHLLADPGTGTHEVAVTVQQDPAIAAKVLQLANSAAFRRGAPTASIGVAVQRLGTAVISRLVLVEGVLATHVAVARFNFPAEARAYFLASLVAEATVSAGPRDEASLAVLLCPIGKLVMIAAAPERMEQVMLRADGDGERAVTEELRLFGTTHAAVGAHLITTWGLPASVAFAVGAQYSGSASDEITAATLLATRDVRGISFAHGELTAFTTAWDRHRARLAFLES